MSRFFSIPPELPRRKDASLLLTSIANGEGVGRLNLTSCRDSEVAKKTCQILAFISQKCKLEGSRYGVSWETVDRWKYSHEQAWEAAFSNLEIASREANELQFSRRFFVKYLLPFIARLALGVFEIPKERLKSKVITPELFELSFSRLEVASVLAAGFLGLIPPYRSLDTSEHSKALDLLHEVEEEMKVQFEAPSVSSSVNVAFRPENEGLLLHHSPPNPTPATDEGIFTCVCEADAPTTLVSPSLKETLIKHLRENFSSSCSDSSEENFFPFFSLRAALNSKENTSFSSSTRKDSSKLSESEYSRLMSEKIRSQRLQNHTSMHRSGQNISKLQIDGASASSYSFESSEEAASGLSRASDLEGRCNAPEFPSFDFGWKFKLESQKISCLLAYFYEIFIFCCREKASFLRKNEDSRLETSFTASSRFPDGSSVCEMPLPEGYKARMCVNQDFLNDRIDVYRWRMRKEPPISFWCDSKALLEAVEVKTCGFIEDEGDSIQADFANKFIGGGVLGGGYAQEEVRFLVFPENLITCLFCEEMSDLEAIITVGAVRYSEHKGFGRSFCFSDIPRNFKAEKKSNNDEKLDFRGCAGEVARDAIGRRCVCMAAFDAVPMRSITEEFSEATITRELNKCFVAFLGDPYEEGLKRAVEGMACSDHKYKADVQSSAEALSSVGRMPVSTGNWGCGVFRGDPQLKFLIQWAAASINGRTMKFFTFKHERLGGLMEFVSWIRRRVSNVGQLVCLIFDTLKPYLKRVEEVQRSSGKKTEKPRFFDFVMLTLAKRGSLKGSE